ncbi:MAG TPA: hypothetical protein VIH15_10345, partial [Casimicrobiaceae bacterium]
FFPDFVAELLDGRIFVIEYKGAPWKHDPKEIEKDQVGRLWAQKSAGKCVFLTAFLQDGHGRNVRGQIDAAIG